MPRIFVAGYYRDCQEWVRRERIQTRPQNFEVVICTADRNVRGHRLRRRDRVVILHGALPEVRDYLRLLESIRRRQLAELEELVAARPGWWRFRRRREIASEIQKIEQELS